MYAILASNGNLRPCIFFKNCLVPHFFNGHIPDGCGEKARVPQAMAEEVAADALLPPKSAGAAIHMGLAHCRVRLPQSVCHGHLDGHPLHVPARAVGGGL